MIKEEQILILGTGGFIGGRAYELFKESEFNVIGTARSGDFIHLDVLTDDWQTKLLELNPSVIINAIAYGNSHDHNDADLIKKTTLEFPQKLIEFCNDRLEIKAFVQLGSSSEYGENCKGADELFELKPNSQYSKCKGELSQWCLDYAHKTEFPLVYFRLFSIYGPHENEGRLIPTLIEYAKKRKFPGLGDAEIARDFVHVDDVVNAFELAVNNIEGVKGQVINLCSGNNTTIKELVYTVKSTFNLDVEPEFGTRPNHKWDLKTWYGNPKKAKELLGWEAKTSLNQFFQEQRHVG